ncbi:hypothetical protein [Lysobacter humi (ex Lee et al. 2017)]
MTPSSYARHDPPHPPSPSLQSSAYALAHLRAAMEAGDPALIVEALAAVPEWVSFYDVRAALAEGGLRLRMEAVPSRRATASRTQAASTPSRRTGDRPG